MKWVHGAAASSHSLFYILRPLLSDLRRLIRRRDSSLTIAEVEEIAFLVAPLAIREVSFCEINDTCPNGAPRGFFVSSPPRDPRRRGESREKKWRNRKRNRRKQKKETQHCP